MIIIHVYMSHDPIRRSLEACSPPWRGCAADKKQRTWAEALPMSKLEDNQVL